MSSKPRVAPPPARKPTVVERAAPPQSQITTQVSIAGWSGPLPAPDDLAQFNRIIPNGAERIMAMVEHEQEARHAIEDRLSMADVWTEVGGRVVGTLLLLACLGAAVWSVQAGATSVVTLGFLGVPLLGAIAKLFERKK